MKQRWEALLFLHWKLPASLIQSSLPPGLIVDTFQGNAYVGIVPFHMRRVRPRYLFCLPGISNFLELNLRTYVKDKAGRKGVWFFSLDANQALAVFIARKLFSLPYYNARMHYVYETDGWHYFTAQRKGQHLQEFRYKSSGESQAAASESLSHFLVVDVDIYPMQSITP